RLLVLPPMLQSPPRSPSFSLHPYGPPPPLHSFPHDALPIFVSRASRTPSSSAPAGRRTSASASNSIPPPSGASRVQLRRPSIVAPCERSAEETSRTIPVRS